MVWSPTRIEVEKAFDKFVENSELGHRVDRIIEIPDGFLNADYYFHRNDVVAELKTLASNPRSIKLFSSRLISSFKKFGYSESDVIGFLLRGEPMPQQVRQNIINIEARSIIEIAKKAYKQIRATKILLKRFEASGLLLIANDNNYGLTPAQALDVMVRIFGLLKDKKGHIDGIVYFTPNVYYNDGTNIAKSVWVPLYNVGSEGLADFVNILGKLWGDFNDRPEDPYLERTYGPSLANEILIAKPIEIFERR